MLCAKWYQRVAGILNLHTYRNRRALQIRRNPYWAIYLSNSRI